MATKTMTLKMPSENPFDYTYDRSEYVVLTSAVRREADSGRLIIKESKSKTDKERNKSEK